MTTLSNNREPRPSEDQSARQEIPRLPSLSGVPAREQLKELKQYYVSLEIASVEVVRNLAEIVHVKFSGRSEVYSYCCDTLLKDDPLITIEGEDREPTKLFQEFYAAATERSKKRDRARMAQDEIVHLDRYALAESLNRESLTASSPLLEPKVDILIREVLDWLDGLDPIRSHGNGMVPKWGSTAATHHEGTDRFTYSSPSREKIATEDRRATALRFTMLFDLPDGLRVCWEKVDEETVNVGGWPSQRPVYGYQVRHWNSRERSLLYNGDQTVDGADQAGYRSVDEVMRFLCQTGLIPVAATTIDLFVGSDGSQDLSQKAKFFVSALEPWRYRLSEDEFLMRARFQYVRSGFPLEHYELFLPFVVKR